MVVSSHYSFLTDSCHFPWFMLLHEPGGEWWLLPHAVRGAKVEGGEQGGHTEALAVCDTAPDGVT